MYIVRTMATVIVLAFSTNASAQSTGHIGHGGSGNDNGCIKARVSRIKPEHLSTVAPGSDFSFAASGSNGPNHIHVSIKNQPIAVSVEDKENFYWVKGKLPDSIKNTTVRISVNQKAKFNKCDSEDGWLLKISE